MVGQSHPANRLLPSQGDVSSPSPFKKEAGLEFSRGRRDWKLGQGKGHRVAPSNGRGCWLNTEGACRLGSQSASEGGGLVRCSARRCIEEELQPLWHQAGGGLRRIPPSCGESLLSLPFPPLSTALPPHRSLMKPEEPPHAVSGGTRCPQKGHVEPGETGVGCKYSPPAQCPCTVRLATSGLGELQRWSPRTGKACLPDTIGHHSSLPASWGAWAL